MYSTISEDYDKIIFSLRIHEQYAHESSFVPARLLIGSFVLWNLSHLSQLAIRLSRSNISTRVLISFFVRSHTIDCYFPGLRGNRIWILSLKVNFLIDICQLKNQTFQIFRALSNNTIFRKIINIFQNTFVTFCMFSGCVAIILLHTKNCCKIFSQEKSNIRQTWNTCWERYQENFGKQQTRQAKACFSCTVLFTFPLDCVCSRKSLNWKALSQRDGCFFHKSTFYFVLVESLTSSANWILVHMKWKMWRKMGLTCKY